MNQAIADTSFVIAVANSDESSHEVCVALYREHEEIYIPQSALTEIAYMLGRQGGNRAVRHFLTRLPETHYRLIPLVAADITRTAALLEQYADARPDFVDLTIIAIAERLNITRVLTLDRRDFSIIRPLHTTHLELLPEQTTN